MEGKHSHFILNYLKNIIKLFENDEYVLTHLLKIQVISYLIMYKSWAWEENQKILIEILFILKETNIFFKIRNLNYTIEELILLESLKDHCCIREEIRTVLRNIFKINII